MLLGRIVLCDYLPVPTHHQPRSTAPRPFGERGLSFSPLYIHHHHREEEQDDKDLLQVLP